jgi:predicted dehydrogenase
VTVGLGFLGLGSAFEAYARQIGELQAEGAVRVVAGFDPAAERRRVAEQLFPSIDAGVDSAEALVDRADVDAVLVLTTIPSHGPLTELALHAGKHVLVEKPVAASLDEGHAVANAAQESGRVVVCGPHVGLSPTYRALHDRVKGKDVGEILSVRARYGWRGPEWAEWYYKPGGGSIFDLGIYNLVSVCGFMGSVQKVAAMVGTAVATRPVNGRPVKLEVEDTAHILLDFGDSRFAVLSTGNVIQELRSPAIELYGESGVLQLRGEDFAPDGFERWHNDRGAWEIYRETAPMWPWTDGVRHLVECIEADRPPLLGPDHALHVLEVALAATQASTAGRTIEIESRFPALDYSTLDEPTLGPRFEHDHRIV